MSYYCNDYLCDVMTEQDLKDHMRGAGGDVLHADVMTLPGGRSKGCGVVEYGEYVQQLVPC
jgi:RNA recognition motif. (a.k.a. RRM, RBD, or RNP domain)